MHHIASRLAVVGFLTLFLPGLAGAVCPEAGTTLFPGSSGQALQDSLRSAFRPPLGWSYNQARDAMYSEIDNTDGAVAGIYTGFTVFVSPTSTDPRGDAFSAGLNAEHVWPQSKGAEDLPMRSDLHHLFPSEINANAARGNFPFAEIPDASTDLWYRLREVTPTPIPAFVDQYSELDQQNPNPNYSGRWEPRESKKGDVARAVFYFYTVYRNEALSGDPSFFDAQKSDLREWHMEDPPDAQEVERTCAIAVHQGDKPNPFVIDPTLVDRAYFGLVPVVLSSFTAQVVDASVVLNWTTSAEANHAGFHVLRENGSGLQTVTPELLRHGPDYRFVDPHPGNDRVTYWLEALARDGSRERFGPQVVQLPDRVAGTLRVWPNPARVGEPIRVEWNGAGPVEAALYDIRGQQVRAWKQFTGTLEDPGESWLAAGVYFLRVQSADQGTRTVRFVVLY